MNKTYSKVLRVLLSLLLLHSECVFGNVEVDEDVKQVVNFGAFYDYKSVLNRYLNQDTGGGIKRLVTLYRLRCLDPQRVENPKKAHPFIILEGTHRTTRSVVGHKLAKRIKGVIVPNPPKYMAAIDDSTKTFRKAFFTLGLYASACEARNLVNERPVIINGHWMFQASFAIAKVFGSIPPPRTSPVYVWPKDMFKPDLVIFINAPKPEDHTTPLPNVFKPILVDVFRQWSHPVVIEFNHTRNFEELTQLSILAINKHLGTNYSIEDEDNLTAAPPM